MSPSCEQKGPLDRFASPLRRFASQCRAETRSLRGNGRCGPFGRGELDATVVEVLDTGFGLQKHTFLKAGVIMFA